VKTTGNEIREQVAAAYTRAVTESGGCCSSSCCGTAPDTKAAELLGYEQKELVALPSDAVQNSFGCGNPVAFSDLAPGETVLDLGCGAGIDLLLAAPKVEAHGKVIGVDMTDEMILRARQNVAASGWENVEVRQGIIEQLPVEDASVDLVISNCVLNLSPDKPQVFAEIVRVLKPGGRMRVSDIVAENLPDWVRESPAMLASCVGGAISEEQYLEGLRTAGLTEVAVVDRLVYDVSQLRELVLADLPLAAEGLAGAELAERAAQALDARVASVLVTGHKPRS
jgi:SAM-dependent methyltransferase